MKKIILPLLLLIPSSMAFASGVSVPFAIPGNQYCDENHTSEVSISISNLSGNEAKIILNLYNGDGDELNVVGTSNNGIQSNITPGAEVTIAPYTTVYYHKPYVKADDNSLDCNRAYRGEITNLNRDAQVIASGWVSGRFGEAYRSGASIMINAGQPF